MFAQVPLFPEQASTLARRVDNLFFFQLAVISFMAVLVTVLILYFSVRYRRRSEHDRTPQIMGGHRLEWFWTLSPLAVFLIMFVWGASIYTSPAIPPEDAEEVFVVGKQWMWKIQHPRGQREINTLHLQVNRPVKLTMTSEDVIHDFFVPAFRTHMDVLPGRYTHTYFLPNKVGSYHLFCSQYCGTSHSKMVGEVQVMEEEDYRAWLGSRAEGSLALQGRKLFLKLQCISCHSSNAQARAPVLENLFDKRVALRDGSSVVADEGYIRESILYPERKVVQGWDPIMPTFKGQVSEEDLIDLISFIRTLGPGQTPTRNEDSVPPLGARTRPAGEKEESTPSWFSTDEKTSYGNEKGGKGDSREKQEATPQDKKPPSTERDKKPTDKTGSKKSAEPERKKGK